MGEGARDVASACFACNPKGASEAVASAVDAGQRCGIMDLSFPHGEVSPAKPTPPEDDRRAALSAHRALNRHPEGVTDEEFLAGAPFFDPHDLVQVKYEMLRRAWNDRDDRNVSRTAAAFGFSRPTFYEAKKAFDTGGLPGLLPQKPGPRRAHKLTAEVLDFLEQVLAGEPGLTAAELARRLHTQFGSSAHPRSIERSLARRKKRGRPTQGAGGSGTHP